MKILHVGCSSEPLPNWLQGEETRMDIDPACNPDIVADMCDMGDVSGYDVTLCSHALEHLAPWQVPIALGQFRKALRDGGHAIFFVPDLDGVTPDHRVLYESPAGPVTGHDLFYGHGPQLQSRPYMAHKCGFIKSTLTAALEGAGFRNVIVKCLSGHNLFGVGEK